MDDAPDFIEVKDVKGRRFKSMRHYVGGDDKFVLDVTYRFKLAELHAVDGARYYEPPKKQTCLQCDCEYEVTENQYHQKGYCGSVCYSIDNNEC